MTLFRFEDRDRCSGQHFLQARRGSLKHKTGNETEGTLILKAEN